jgi:hypothetical protein
MAESGLFGSAGDGLSSGNGMAEELVGLRSSVSARRLRIMTMAGVSAYLFGVPEPMILPWRI